MARLCTALLVSFVLLIGCRVEPIPGAADADSTQTSGSYDRQPAASAEPLASGQTPRPPAADAPDTAVLPNPRPVNPPTVDPEGAPPVPPVAVGDLVIPVAGIRPGDLSDTFTDARSAGRQHNAIDIMAPRGRTVYAAVAGEVLRLFTSERGGLTVYQLGPDGKTVYYYAHLDAYAPGLADGQQLAQGEPVGTVGDSGNAQPGNTHLHFAMWRVDDPAQFWDGEPINPYPLLVGR